MNQAKNESDRVKILNEIAASRDDQLKLELASGGLGDEPFEAPPPPEEIGSEPKQERDEKGKFVAQGGEQPAPVAEPEGEPETEAAPAPVTEPPAPEMVKIKVDGEEIEVTKEEVDRAGNVNLLQMERAMQKRLKETNDRHRELGEALRQLRQPAPADQQPRQDPNQALVERINALRFGTDEEAAKAMRELLQPATPPVDQMYEHFAKRLEWDTAVKQFKADNADLLQDPDIRSVVVARENLWKQQIMSQRQWPTDIAKFYKDLGAELRPKFGKPAAVDLAARREQKARLAEPTAAAGKIPAAPQDKEPTTSEKINQMRKARGQAPLT